MRRGSTGAKPFCCADGTLPIFRGMVQVASGGQLVAIAEIDRGEIVPKRVFNLSGVTGRADRQKGCDDVDYGRT